MTTPITMSLKYEVCGGGCVCLCIGWINFWRQSKVAADKQCPTAELGTGERVFFLLMRVFVATLNQVVFQVSV